MKKAIFKAKNNIKNQKKLYVILIGLALLALIFGIVFVFLISEENMSYIKENLTIFFSSIKDKNRFDSFLNSLLNNNIYIIGIWLLGISIIGLPIIVIILLFKFFIFGFSLSSIIFTFQWSGILKAIVHLFPHQIMFLIVMILISFYAISFCIKLFNYLFFKKIINFKDVMSKYMKILLICFLTNLFISFYEAYVSTYFLSLFN